MWHLLNSAVFAPHPAVFAPHPARILCAIQNMQTAGQAVRITQKMVFLTEHVKSQNLFFF